MGANDMSENALELRSERLYVPQRLIVADGFERSELTEDREMVQHSMRALEEALERNPSKGEEETADDILDIALRAGLLGYPTIRTLLGAAMEPWKGLMPSAKALYPLQRPDSDYLPNSSRTAITPELRELFRHSFDAIGIRTRAQIMGWQVKDHAERIQKDHLTWMSLGCGAALPVLDAMKPMRTSDKTIDLKLVDWDIDALNFASELAEKQGLKVDQDYTVLQRNLLKDLILEEGRLVQEERGKVDVVDLLGVFEYFKKERSAAALLNRSYQLLAPGGRLIFANMLKRDPAIEGSPGHPQLEVNQRAVGWPSIRPRTVAEVMNVIETAGLPLNERMQSFVAQDEVYLVVSIDKPGIPAQKASGLGGAALLSSIDY